jgi:hypothetical protein
MTSAHAMFGAVPAGSYMPCDPIALRALVDDFKKAFEATRTIIVSDDDMTDQECERMVAELTAVGAELDEVLARELSRWSPEAETVQ